MKYATRIIVSGTFRLHEVVQIPNPLPYAKTSPLEWLEIQFPTIPVDDWFEVTDENQNGDELQEDGSYAPPVAVQPQLPEQVTHG